MKHHAIRGGGGVDLHAVETGRPGGRAILFVHGWSQSHYCWHRQLECADLAERFRLIAIDLRGSGGSAKPLDGYADGSLWARDIAAVIEDLHLDDVVIAGWSYGGYVICDYVRAYTDRALGGIAFVSASTDLGIDVAYRARRAAGWEGLLARRGSGVPGVFSDDAESAVAMMELFLNRVPYKPFGYGEALALLATNLQTPPRVREATLARKVSSDDVLKSLRVPVLVGHGENDTIIDPATALHIAGLIPTASVSLYAACGHAPFLEYTDRFNTELATFASSL